MEFSARAKSTRPEPGVGGSHLLVFYLMVALPKTFILCLKAVSEISCANLSHFLNFSHAHSKCSNLTRGFGNSLGCREDYNVKVEPPCRQAHWQTPLLFPRHPCSAAGTLCEGQHPRRLRGVNGVAQCNMSSSARQTHENTVLALIFRRIP